MTIKCDTHLMVIIKEIMQTKNENILTNDKMTREYTKKSN
jgi:hypothetical protein